jgi:hypothetical protein
MSYYRNGYRSFREFQRESFFEAPELGKEELELLRELDIDDEMRACTRGRRRSQWD